VHVADEDIPRLPRSRAIKLSRPALFRIAFTAGMLVAIVMLARPCGDAVSGFVMKFDTKGSAGSATVAAPPAGSGNYEQLRPDMSEAEVKAAIERAKQKARATGSP